MKRVIRLTATFFLLWLLASLLPACANTTANTTKVTEECSLQVKVCDSQKVPVKGATVMILDTDIKAITDQEGMVLFKNLKPKPDGTKPKLVAADIRGYDIVVFKPGHGYLASADLNVYVEGGLTYLTVGLRKPEPSNNTSINLYEHPTRQIDLGELLGNQIKGPFQ